MSDEALNDENSNDLIEFLVGKSKSTDKPLSLNKLAEEFKEKTNASEPSTVFLMRIYIQRLKIHQMKQFDIETKVKISFALGAHLDDDFLAELKQNADVEIDDKKRIIKYKKHGGGLELNGVHNKLAKLSEEESRMLKFLKEKCMVKGVNTADDWFKKDATEMEKEELEDRKLIEKCGKEITERLEEFVTKKSFTFVKDNRVFNPEEIQKNISIPPTLQSGFLQNSEAHSSEEPRKETGRSISELWKSSFSNLTMKDLEANVTFTGESDALKTVLLGLVEKAEESLRELKGVLKRETAEKIPEKEKRMGRKRLNVSFDEPSISEKTPSKFKKLSEDFPKIEAPRRPENSVSINFSPGNDADVLEDSSKSHGSKGMKNDSESSSVNRSSERLKRNRLKMPKLEEQMTPARITTVKVKWEPEDEGDFRRRRSCEKVEDDKEAMKTRSGRSIKSPLSSPPIPECHVIDSDKYPFTYTEQKVSLIPRRTGKIIPETASRPTKHDFKISGSFKTTEDYDSAIAMIDRIIDASDPSSDLRKTPHFKVTFTGNEKNPMELEQLKSDDLPSCSSPIPSPIPDANLSRILKGILLFFLQLDLKDLLDLRMEIEKNMNKAKGIKIPNRKIQEILKECVIRIVDESEESSEVASIGLHFLLDRLKTSVRWIPSLNGFRKTIERIIENQKEDKDVRIDKLKAALEMAIEKFFS